MSTTYSAFYFNYIAARPLTILICVKKDRKAGLSIPASQTPKKNSQIKEQPELYQRYFFQYLIHRHSIIQLHHHSQSSHSVLSVYPIAFQ